MTLLQTIKLNCSAAGIVHAACSRKWFLTPAFSSSSPVVFPPFRSLRGRLPPPPPPLLRPPPPGSLLLSPPSIPPRGGTVASAFLGDFTSSPFRLPLAIRLHFVNLPGVIFLIGIRVNIRQPQAHSPSLPLSIIPLSPSLLRHLRLRVPGKWHPQRGGEGRGAGIIIQSRWAKWGHYWCGRFILHFQGQVAL